MPLRAARSIVVPAGATVSALNAFQTTDVRASKTRDTNRPLEAYGVMVMSSSAMVPPPRA